MTFHQYTFSERDRDDPLAKCHSSTGKYEGIVEKRSTTDCLFLLLIIAAWAAMTVIGYHSIQNGNPWRLIRPIDDQGQVCGQTPAVQDLEYFYSVLPSGVGVCVSGCYDHYNSSYTSLNVSDYHCLHSVYENAGTGPSLSAYIYASCFENGEFKIDSNCGCMLKFNSESVLRRCTFTHSSVRDEFDSQRIRDFLINFCADVLEVKEYVFGYGAGLAIFLGFVWVTILRFRFFSFIFTWASIILVQGTLVLLSIASYETVEDWKDDTSGQHDSTDILAMRIVSGISIALSIIWFLFICINVFNIQLAIKTLSLTAECIEQMPMIIFTPLVQTFAFLLFFVPWGVYLFYTASLGSLTPHTYIVNDYQLDYVQYSIDKSIAYKLIYLLAMYLWTAEWILAVGSIIVSIAVAKWYFTVPDQRGVIKGSLLLCEAYGATIRYHLGTAAFGSLIVSIVEFIRYWILYIEAKMEPYMYNPVIRYVFCCVNCCLWCLEQCLRFISRTAYIQTAIHGSSFCFACKEGFFLVCRNVLRVGALHVVSGLAMMIGKLFVTGFVGVAAYYVFSEIYAHQLQGMAAPTIMTMIVAFNVACMFTEVMNTGVDCMIQCYITDEERNDGKAVYATHSMKSFIDENAMTQEQFDRMNPRFNPLQEKQKQTEMNPMQRPASEAFGVRPSVANRV